MAKVYSYHTLDTEMAVKYGVNAAFIYHHISYICNIKDSNYLHEGKYWYRCSLDRLTEIFPFMCKRTIQNAISILLENNELFLSNYNKFKNDHTCWYSTDKEAEIPKEDEEIVKNEEKLGKQNLPHLDVAKFATTSIYNNNNSSSEELEVPLPKKKRNPVKDFEMTFSEDYQKTKSLLLNEFQLTFKTAQIIDIVKEFQTFESLNKFIDEFMKDPDLNKMDLISIRKLLAAKFLSVIGDR